MKARGRVSDIKCACGKTMLASSVECFYCVYRKNGWKSPNTPQRIKKVRPRKPKLSTAPRHVPQRSLLKHEPIELTYFWRNVVSL